MANAEKMRLEQRQRQVISSLLFSFMYKQDFENLIRTWSTNEHRLLNLCSNISP